MAEQHRYLWTLADYQRLLMHPEVFVRRWAKDRIRHQYPAVADQALAPLADDPDEYLQSEAVRALARLDGEEHEQKLLALYTTSEAANRQWVIHALGERQSAPFLPMLLAEIDQLDLTQAQRHTYPKDYTAIDALGYYAAPQARQQLERILERYPFDDPFAMRVVRGSLRFASADRLADVIARIITLPLATNAGESTLQAVAEMAGVARPFQETVAETDPFTMVSVLEAWFDTTIELPELVDAVLSDYNSAFAGKDPAKPIGVCLAEMERMAAERQEDLPAWLVAWTDDAQPTGYRRRTLVTYQTLRTLTHLPLTQLHHNKQTHLLALALTLFGQYLIDQNDEANLQAVQSPEERSRTLLAILTARRENVLATVEQEVAALGPTILPALTGQLAVDHFWPLLRTIRVIEQLARTQPGAADAAVDGLLALLADDVESDYLTEALTDALRAIGPAIIAPVSAALADAEFGYQLYAVSALAEIPVQASVDTLHFYFDGKEILGEFEWESLVDLGQLASLEFLQRYYFGEKSYATERNGKEHLATALYTLGLLHNVTGEAMAEWGQLAYAEDLRVAEIIKQFSRFGLADEEDEPDEEGAERSSLTRSNAAARRTKKKKRTQAKATQKAQRKAKKKKKRR